MKKIMMAASVAALACGCVSVNKNDGGNSCLKPCPIKDRVHVKFEVGKDRVQASDQLNCLFGWICWGSTAHIADQGEFGFGAQAKAKNGAYANACDAAKCDSIAAARYKIETEDYFVFKKVKAEVSGYPVKVIGTEVVDGLKFPAPCPASARAPKTGFLPLF